MKRVITIARIQPSRLVASLSLIAPRLWEASRRIGLCTLLGMIASAPRSLEARPFAYVANTNSHDVSVIDLATDAVIATIPLGASVTPHEVAITPDGIRAYVTTGSAGLVKVIDADPTSSTYNMVITTVTIGGFPQAVAISPDGALAYVTDFARASVSAIDTRSNTVIAMIPVGRGPNGVVFSPDGTLAYVVNYSADLTLSIIDTARSTVVNTITFPPNAPESIAITPDGALLYITRSSSNSVTVLDATSFTVVANVRMTASGQTRISISPDGRFAYVTQGFSPGTVDVIDTSSQSVVATVNVGRSPYGVAVTPDSARTYVPRFDNTVDVIDAATNTVVNTVMVGMQPQGIAITPFISDVGISQSATPDPVMSGANLTYTLTVTNNGPDPALSITVTDLLPTGTTFISCAATGTGVCSGSDATQTVTFARLESGATETITIVTTVNADVPDQTVISNTATVSSRTYDPVSNNNSSTVTVTVSNPAPGARSGHDGM